MKRKVLSFALAIVTAITMTACGGGEKKADDKAATQTEQKADDKAAETKTDAPALKAAADIKKPESDVDMAKITPEDAKAKIGAEDTIFLDVRKADDYAAGHIQGAVSADMDAYNKGGDFESGVKNMQAVVTSADKNIILICYSGKSYAQAATNVLSAMGYDMTKVSTLKGGMKAWTSKFPDDGLEK